VRAVQDAAVEHALTVGESRRALALAGALDPLGDASDGEPPVTALTTTLTAWLGLRGRDRPFAAGSPSSTLPGTGAAVTPDFEPSVSPASTDPDHRPAAVGAAVACDRFDVDPGRAARLADCSRGAVTAALAARAGNGPDEPSRPEGGDR